jgi:hypothetical protein
VVLSLLLASLLTEAQEISLWKEKQPGYRKSLEVGDWPEHLFVPQEVNQKKGADDNAVYKDKVKDKLPVMAIMWSEIPAQRRVLMEDIVLQVGESIPSYVFNDNHYYILKEVGENYLKFQVKDETLTTVVSFEIPFDFKTVLRNQSNASDGAEKSDANKNAPAR